MGGNEETPYYKRCSDEENTYYKRRQTPIMGANEVNAVLQKKPKLYNGGYQRNSTHKTKSSSMIRRVFPLSEDISSMYTTNKLAIN